MNLLYEFDDIEDYIHGRMSEPDRMAFEDALQSDADLARRVEALQLESKVLRMLRNEHLLAQLDGWSKEVEPEKKTAPPSNSGTEGFIHRKWIVVACVAALLGGLFLVKYSGIFNTKKRNDIPPPPAIKNDTTSTRPPKNPGESIANEKTPPPPPVQKPKVEGDYADIASNSYMDEDFSQTLMGTGEEGTKTLYERAVKLYGDAQYEEALKLLETLDKNREEESLYLRGYAYYHSGQYAKAEADFRRFRDYGDSDRKLDAIWCEVFCLTKQLPGARTRLDAVLKEITSNPKHPYYDRAKALEKSLMEKGQK